MPGQRRLGRQIGQRRLGRQIGQRRWRLVVCVLIGCVLLAACTVGPSQRPPVAVRGDGPVVGPSDAPPASTPPVPPLEPGQPSPVLDFAPCSPSQVGRIGNPVLPDRSLSFECATIEVETVGGGSGGVEQISVGLVRVGLAEPVPNRAPIVVLGESDGLSSSALAARIAAAMPLPMLQRVQLIGLDRRGSVVNRLDCSPDAARAAIINFDAHRAEPATLDGLLEQSRMIVQECYTRLPDGLESFATGVTANDVERVRRLLGVNRLPAVGLGDGARAVSVFADRFPQQTGRVVLDTPPDPTLDVIAAARARAAAGEGAFEAFARDCTARPGCPLGADPRGVAGGLVDRLGTQPLVGVNGRQLTSGALISGLRRGLDDPAGWPTLAQSLAAVNNGDPAGMLALLDPVIGPDSNFDVALATECNDTKQRVAPTQALDLIRQWRTELPLFGPQQAAGLLSCAAWPVPAESATTGPANGAPPILVLGTAGDPRTPLDGAQRAAGALSSARIVSWQGAGHGAYPRTPCVSDAVHTLLIEGKPPATNLLCPP